MTSVGKPLPHDSARGHVTGSALFIDDMPAQVGELHVGFVGSPVACGEIMRIDVEAALKTPGVVACYTAEDVAGHNVFGLIVADDPFLAQEEVMYVGQPVVVVAAENPKALELGRRAVVIECREQTPVLTIEQAIQANRYLGPVRKIARGRVDENLASAPHRIAGTFKSGGQEQFYLESQAALAYPGEQGQIVVHSSTQNTTEIQAVVAEVLGLGQHEVICICKRMGGAFGGKETQAAIPAIMAALVASKTGRAARVIYNKDDDMCVTGKRHEYFTRWDCGFDNAGHLLALRCEYFSNGGATTDLSPSVMERTLLHGDNAYFLPHVEFTGKVCFTNLPPNTAFRGFGGPQGMLVIENVLETIAEKLGLDALQVRRANVYGVGTRNVTPYGQVVDKNHLPEIFETLAADSDYERRREEIAQFNAKSRLQVRGLALTGMKFGISFTTKFLNQGNALVNVYTDGTIQVSTGATEMGQGVNVKIRQLVADEFAIDPRRVLMMATSTEKNNNTSPTAASAGTDLNGAAAVVACQEIKTRLRSFAAEHLADSESGLVASPEHICFAEGTVHDDRRPQVRIPFEQLCEDARRDRVDLGSRGFFATPGIDFNRETGRGTPFFYFTQGAAVAEVVIDRFTGEMRVLRVDLLIDIGKSINPGVDRGQIIGGFVQGMGWVTNECLTYNDKGELLSHSPTTYKIPAVTDIPPEFNVRMFPNHDNTQNIGSSKAVGEPPLMLALSVWAAARNAISYVKPGAEIDLKSPATGEEILRVITALQQDTEPTQLPGIVIPGR
ncbi:xanthine dehydrogenase molybdopterin binding subunit [Bythopirellula polymerisocia]|uniref:Xanthine dehydrogenase molybdenum-binding subunit n=1 Tax=Bythopirellula polymerisocia TaxID=2528003 RepID=A0A5C6CHF8_9BACT|nr:xanthine dehydrogenase molybdopterin binding subunit [Bythopirellula polymerisocia]TWU22656.1 Xanthine dehydrogenase molybdenum-binding subunit [Bythopirellula polymerisocia]